MSTDTTEWDTNFIAFHVWPGDIVERFRAGLLPRDELLGLINEVAFLAGVDLNPFHRLDEGDINHHPDVGPHRACFTTRQMTAVTADQWVALQAVSAVFPVAVVKPKRHQARCPFCEASAVAYSAVVGLQCGPYELRHEYELPRK